MGRARDGAGADAAGRAFHAAETRTYLRDCFDHAVAVLELVESYREMTNGLMEVYLMDNVQPHGRGHEDPRDRDGVLHAAQLPGGHLRHELRHPVGNMPELGWAKLPLVPLVVTPDGEGVQDSTPIIERFEASNRRSPKRSHARLRLGAARGVWRRVG